MVLFIVANYKNINYNSNNKILEFQSSQSFLNKI